LIVAKGRRVDIQELLSYELSSIPQSLARMDGSLLKTVKAQLLHQLETSCKMLDVLPPCSPSSCSWLIDAMALLQMIKKCDAKTFKDLSDTMLHSALKPIRDGMCNQVDVVFDRYDDEEHSIKAGERTRRQQVQGMKIVISKPSQPIPKQLNKFLQDGSNKAQLAAFISEDWCHHAGQKLREGQTIIVSGGFKDRLLARQITQDGVIDRPDLSASHEEADTRLILHASRTAVQRIVIASPDTDVAVICISHVASLTAKEVWFRTGVKDHARFIPLHSIAQEIGPLACQQLPAFHALTGCDSTSAPSGRGKTIPWKLIKKCPERFEGIAQVGSEPSLSDDAFHCVELFTIAMYDPTTRVTEINKLRYQLFCKKQTKTEALPPTADALRQHAMRACYQTYVWRKAVGVKPIMPSPIGFGWSTDDDGHIEPVLMTQEPAPMALTELTRCLCDPEKSACQGRCSCLKQQLACTQACKCEGGNSCQNKFSAAVDNDDASDDDLSELSDSETETE